MSKCQVLHILLIVISFLVFLAVVLFNILAATAAIDGLFLTTPGNISDKYQLEITPDRWTFSIWSIIYIWNGLWLVYTLSTLCRRNSLGLVYCTPDVHPPEFYVIWIINSALNVSWLFLWDRKYIIAALAFIALISFTSCVMMILSYRNCYKHGAWLSHNSPADLWLVRLLVHNGIAMYATWTSIATFLHFGIVLKYEAKVEDSLVSTAVLCILLFELLLWFMLENLVFEEYTRYTFTVYPVVIVALTGCYTKNYNVDAPSTNNVFIVVLLGISSALCAVRLIVICFCHKMRPLFPRKSIHTMKDIQSSHVVGSSIHPHGGTEDCYVDCKTVQHNNSCNSL
ncbi:uncharacterized protein LOC106702621 [Latimeria chalumnae]|uniref:uncharacterized protein LOC106702621 n=1 Tax=Latimeria chalumnae TaxID=7897 RepID=UPI0006D8E68A|nr:PREDICTED: uncharacterized protein LOC106702621 [Latimeria chalumnae]|eukprot:XP_014340885.1 PREDICTED: uncharacterized protein LOC106702621 [Latimeria chalumnae]